MCVWISPYYILFVLENLYLSFLQLSFQDSSLPLWLEAASRVFSRSRAPLQMTWLLALVPLVSQCCATFRWQRTVWVFACLMSRLTMQPPSPRSFPKPRRLTRSMVKTSRAGLPLTTFPTPFSPMSPVCLLLFSSLQCFQRPPPNLFHVLYYWAVVQNIYSRPSIFDGQMAVSAVEDVMGTKPPKFWLSVQVSLLPLFQKYD